MATALRVPWKLIRTTSSPVGGAGNFATAYSFPNSFSVYRCQSYGESILTSLMPWAARARGSGIQTVSTPASAGMFMIVAVYVASKARLRSEAMAAEAKRARARKKKIGFRMGRRGYHGSG